MAAAVSVPVIGNGDVVEPEDAVRMLELTGCAGVMIGRGPWAARGYSKGPALPAHRETPAEPSPAERIGLALRHLDLAVAFKCEKVASKEMRKHLAWYIRGLRGAARMREVINSCPDSASLRRAMEGYLDAFGASC